jgi:pimeloyl-ACP methyl ester carboxylesterase
MKPTYTQTSGLTLATYEKPGSGTPIIFLHGISSSSQVFEKIWNDNKFADAHLFAFDLPGHGKSPFASDPSDYTIIKLSKLVADVINQKQFRDAVLIAHSIGGHLGLHAMRFTDGIKGIMLSDTAPCHGPESIPAGYAMSEDIMAFFKSQATEEELAKALNLEVLRNEHQDVVRNSYLSADGRIREILASEIGTFFGSKDFVSEVDLMQDPGLQTAMIIGEHERMINRTYLEGLSIANLWKDQVHVVSQSAHCPMLENPDEFSELVRGFVAEVHRR